MDEGFYKKMFLVGAIWNVAGGAVIVWLTGWIFASAHLSPTGTLGLLLFLDCPVRDLRHRLLPGIPRYVWEQKSGNSGDDRQIRFRGHLHCRYDRPSWATIPRFFLIPVIGDLVFVWLFWRFLRFARQMGR